jgi:hypothetical protein
VTDDIDIYRSAQLLIKQYGEDAAIHAAMEADACLERGDLDGKATWIRVIKAIKELSAPATALLSGEHDRKTLH